MGREVRRVPLDFDWPLREIWSGFVMPEELRLPSCPDCQGRGYSPEARHLFDLWYGYVEFRPEDNGSVPLTPSTPAVRAFAERNVSRSSAYYGRGEWAVVREATRLVNLWNGCWSHHLNADDVAALVESDRLWDLTKTFVPGDGWRSIEPKPMPTPDQVNEWSILTFGHNSINASVVVRARAEREGLPLLCPTCNGDGDVATPEQRTAHESWERTDPPTGDGWQLWETVSEGSPISPVFATADELAEWMTRDHCTVNGPVATLDAAMKFVTAGWAPSFVSTPETGLVDGVTFVGLDRSGGTP